MSVQLQSIDGEAKNLQDFSLLSSQVVLASGETSKLLSLIIVDDLIPEMSESFTVELVNQVTGGAVLGVAYRAVITIEPSDDPNGVFGEYHLIIIMYICIRSIHTCKIQS